MSAAGGASAPCDPNLELMQAWRAYQKSPDADNTARWLQQVNLRATTRMDGSLGPLDIEHPHLQSSMWAIYVAGFMAGVDASAAVAASYKPPKGGFTANVRVDAGEPELIRDPDGPWINRTDLAVAIARLKDQTSGAKR